MTATPLPPGIAVVPDVTALDLETDDAGAFDRADKVHLMVLEVVGDTLVWNHYATRWELFLQGSVHLAFGLVGKAPCLPGRDRHHSTLATTPRCRPRPVLIAVGCSAIPITRLNYAGQ